MNLLQMSAAGALLILAVVLVRLAALRAVPKRTFLFLWALVLIRLLVPFPPLLPLPSLLPAEFLRTDTIAATAAPSDPAAQPAPIPTAGRETLPPPAQTAAPGGAAVEMPAVTRPPAVSAPPAQPQGTISAAPVLPVTEISARMARLEQAALLLWLAGMAVTAAVFAILYILNYRRFHRAAPLEGPAAAAWLASHPTKRKLRLRSLPALASPLTYGILRPVILLPEGLELREEGAAYALEHEYIHARRLDALWKLLLAVTVTAHWFNPFVWLMWFLANRDLELSCDEEVLRRYDTDRRGGYARALLDMEEKRSLLPPLHSGFGAGATKERILAIMKYKKATLLSIALAAVLVAALAACALGGRKAVGQTLLPEALKAQLSAVAQMDEEGTLYYVSRQDEGFSEVSGLLDSLRGKPSNAPESGEEQRFQLSLADGSLHTLTLVPGKKAGEVYAALDGDWTLLKTKEEPGEALAELCRRLCPRPAGLTPADGELTPDDRLTAEMEYPDYDKNHTRVCAILTNHGDQEFPCDSMYPFEFQYLGEWYRLPGSGGYQLPMNWVLAGDTAAARDTLDQVEMELIPGQYRFRVSFSVRRPMATPLFDRVTYAEFRVVESAERRQYAPLDRQSLDPATAEAEGCCIVTGGEAASPSLAEEFLGKVHAGVPCELRLIYPEEGKVCHITHLWNGFYGSCFRAETFRNGETETALFPYLALSPDGNTIVLSTFPDPALSAQEGIPTEENDLLPLFSASEAQAEILLRQMSYAADGGQERVLQSVVLSESGETLRILHFLREERYELAVGSMVRETYKEDALHPVHLTDLGNGRVLVTLAAPDGHRQTQVMELRDGSLRDVENGTGAVLYRNGAFLLPVPEEYDALLTVETPEDDARGTLFNVTEIASREAGQKLHPGEDWGDGWLFGIRRVSREELGALLSRDMTGMDVFAKDLSGNYYLCTHPSDVRFVPESGESSDEGWQQWMTLCAWIDRALADFIEMNPGVFAETRSQTEADVLLARARYRGEEAVTVSRGEESYDARGFDGWETAAEGLVWNADFTLLDSATAPEGEPVVLSFAVGPPYELRFWPGSDLAALDDGRNESKWYRGTLRSSAGETVGDLALSWFETAAGRGESVTGPDGVQYAFFTGGGYTLPVPAAYAELVTVETPEDDPAGTLFIVTETASWEVGQKLHPGEERGDGLLFAIRRVSEAALGNLMAGDMGGMRCFAREETGNYLLMIFPTEERFVSTDAADEHQAEWEALNDWARNAAAARLLEANPGLTPYPHANTPVDILLARTLYAPGSGVTLRIGQREGVDPLGTESALASACELVWNYSVSEEARAGDAPKGANATYLVLSDPAAGTELTFWMDSDIVKEDYGGGKSRYYRMAALDGSRRVAGNAVFSWYWNAALTEPVGGTVSFMNGSYTLSLPAQFAEDLIVEAPENGSVLFRVWEKASHARWEARGAHEGDERNGWLFTLRRLNEGDWGRWLADTAGGAFSFAREEDGHYYIYEYPLWETFAPEGEDGTAERAGDAYFRWMAANRAVGSEDIAEGFIRDNASQGLAPYRASLADEFLAEIFSGVPAAVRRAGGEGFDPMAKESSARPLRQLLFHIDYRETEAFAPSAEEAVIFETADGSLSLWPGSDRAVLERYGMTFYYTGTAWLTGSQQRPGDLAEECLTAAANIFPDAWAEIDYRSLEELLESSTDVLAARCTREAVRAGDGWDYGFTVLRSLKGSTGEGELTVHTAAQKVGATAQSGGFFAGDPDYRAGEEYLLVLERQRSVFFPADRYFAYFDILLPLTGDQAASIYDEPLEKHSAVLRSDSAGEDILRYVQDVIGGFPQDSPEYYGTDYIEASSLEEAKEAAQFILRIEPTRLDGAGSDGRELLSCRVLETVKGDLGFLTAAGENQPESRILLVFFPGVLELGREYYVCVNQVSPPEGILFVPVSKEHCFYR